MNQKRIELLDELKRVVYKSCDKARYYWRLEAEEKDEKWKQAFRELAIENEGIVVGLSIAYDLVYDLL
jgi:hypothetical protein